MSSIADRVEPVLTALVGSDPKVRIRFWDGSAVGRPGAGEIVVRSPAAFRRLLYAPGELGLGRAYVAGDIDIEGDIFAVLSLRDEFAARHDRTGGIGDRPALLRAARAVGAIGPPPPRPEQEARLRGRRHSRRRDAAAIAHHYDVSNDFYRFVLGETMTYSCAYFATDDTSLDDAQSAKYELICRKLGLQPGMRLLDVGCGWGGMVMHAARHHGVEAVGITLSRAQHEGAEKRIAEAGLVDRVEVRLQDYRDVSDGPYDAIASIGMFEHVGLARLQAYFGNLFGLLSPRGRMLNHAISRPRGVPGLDRRSFVGRYVFPDGELLEVGSVVSAMHRIGFEVRDVESLREHYARTLRMWVSRLEAHWDEAVAAAGEPRARIWRLYMAASAINFEAGRTSVHQVLGVVPDGTGASGMPMVRDGFIVPRDPI